MRYLAIMAAVAAFAWGSIATVQADCAGVTHTVQSGVPTPKQAPAPRPPMGGASLSPDQVKAVAAYVHSLGGGK